MAYSPGPFHLTLKLLDNGGQTFYVRYRMAAAIVGQTAAEAAVADLITNWAGVSGLTIPRYILSRKFFDGAIVAPVSAVARRKKAAWIVVKDSADPTKRHQHLIEGPLNAIFTQTSGGNPNYNKVNTTLAALTNYFLLFGTTNDWLVISDGEQVPSTNPVLTGKRITK